MVYLAPLLPLYKGRIIYLRADGFFATVCMRPWTWNSISYKLEANEKRKRSKFVKQRKP
jgi:hypothetical protein